MAKFYIKKLSIFGEGKTPSYIDFGKGLNIIHGVSDTGKTCILNCIDFVFGSKNNIPIPEPHGYTDVQLIIETDNGNITLERTVAKNKIKVTSENPAILSNEYKYTEIGLILLALIGIVDNPLIIKNSRYEKQRLTWRTFMHSFLLTEEDVIQKPPILISKETMAKTSSMSGLLYLISAHDFSKIDENEDKKIREARKRAVETYIYKEIDELSDQKICVNKLLETIDPEYAENAIQSLVDELSIVEGKIAQEVNRSKSTLSKIFSERDRLAECNLLLDRYAELYSQYMADIKRLSFIVDGETSMSDIPAPEKCPFCEGAMPEHNHTSYIESANAELDRIARLLNDLTETEKTVIVDRENAEKTLKILISDREAIESIIKKELQPKAQNLKSTLRDYRYLVSLQNELEVIEKMKIAKMQDLNEMLAKKDEKPAEYKPREHFPVGFATAITELLMTTLRRCKYENLVDGVFSLNDFDVIVNSKRKENYGKGYRAFLNVVIAIVMRDYLCKRGKFAPRLLIIDSPLLSLEQGVEDEASDSMKAALITYLMETQNIGQTIIIENNIPELNYSNYNVTLHKFTKGKSEGRHGLLEDVHE